MMHSFLVKELKNKTEQNKTTLFQSINNIQRSLLSQLEKIQNLFHFLIFPGWHSGQFWSIVLLFYSQFGILYFKSKGHMYYNINSLDCFSEAQYPNTKQLVNFDSFIGECRTQNNNLGY